MLIEDIINRYSFRYDDEYLLYYIKICDKYIYLDIKSNDYIELMLDISKPKKVKIKEAEATLRNMIRLIKLKDLNDKI